MMAAIKKYKPDEEKVNRLIQDLIAREFAKKSLDKGKIPGPEVLEFCEHKQINLFVLFQVYQDWNSYMHRIVHPYFDFEHVEVRTALDQFLNVVSQHIYISENDYRKLLESAVFNTVKLMLNPEELLSKFFFGTNTRIPVSVFDKYAGYFSDFGFAIQAIRDYFEKNLVKQVEKADFLNKFEKVIELYEKRTGKPVRNYQDELFRKAFGVEPESVLFKEPEKPEPKPENNLAETKKVEFEKVEIEKQPVNPEQQPKNEKLPIDLFGGSKQVPVEPEEELPKTLADQFRSNQNETENVLDQFSKGNGKTIDIPVHKQFQFVQKIFAGSSVKYKVVLEKIGQASDAGAAQDILNKYVLNSNEINTESEVVKEFVELIRSRF